MNIKRTIARLEDIITYSEKEFLAIGKTLGDIDHQAASIAEEARNLTEQTSDSLFEKQHAQFDRFLQDSRLSSPLPRMFDEGFKRITQLLDNQHHLLTKLVGHMKNVKKTDLVVRVELTHLDGVRDGYAQLNDEVTRTADDIMNRTTSILSINQALLELLEKAGIQARDLFDNIEDRTLQILETSHVRLQFMFDHHKQSRVLADELNGGSAELLQRLDSMVGKLQTHDIVRQQLQQVISFLGIFSTLQDPVKLLDSAIETLSRANGEFFEAVDHIRMQLVTINTHLTLLLEQCIQLSSRSRSIFLDPENHPHLHMEGLVSAADLCISLERVLDPLMKELVDHLGIRESELQEINNLSGDIALLSQNAALTAEQADRGRTSFTVMAEQTQRDIASVRISLDRLLSEQQRIEQETADFISMYQKTDQNMELFFEKTSTVDELLQPLEHMQMNTTRRFGRMIPQMGQLITDINALIATFHTDPHHSSAIGEAIAVLTFTRNEISPRDHLVGEKPEDYQTLRSKIEKSVHKSFINPPLTQPSLDGSSHPDLGEDIELF